jgi:predicted RNA-binding protein YlqC (UPF0109 family)
MQEKDSISNMVEVIAKAICDYPNDVKVREVPGTITSIIDVKVNKVDLGKMIGKDGQTAHSIRRIMFAASFKTKKRYNLDIAASE